MSNIVLAPAPPTKSPAPRRRRGRPVLMSPENVLERIRSIAVSDVGLFQVHRRHAVIYARARRQFGSWARAVAAAGFDYAGSLRQARARSVRNRRRRAQPADAQ